MAAEEWSDARKWIISTDVDLDGRRMEQSESLLDFVASLRDGVVLCSIANIIKPDSVQFTDRKILNVEKHEFLCRKNISAFGNACKDVFRMKGDEVFETSDLFEASKFEAVVNTLSVMSNHPECIAKGWDSFSVVPNKKRSKEKDLEVYGSLSEDIEGLASRVVSSENTDENGDNIYNEENFNNTAYESIIYNGTPHIILPDMVSESVAVGKREHIINEILDTEEGYVRHLETIVESYVPALQPYLTPEDNAAVFLNIDQLCTLHVNFHRELSIVLAPCPGMDVPCKADLSTFQRYKERFLVYAYYCTHLDASQKRVDRLNKKPAFRNTVEELNTKYKRRISLKSQLSVCFQRVLKYKLLLADLLKNTPAEHHEHVMVTEALHAMEDVASFINEFKRDYETVSEMEQIQRTLKFTSSVGGSLESLRSDFGRHVHDGEVAIQMEGSNKKEVRSAFLFEKTLLLCSVSSGSGGGGVVNEVKHIMDVENLIVKNTQPTTRRKSSRQRKEEEKVAHCFTLCMRQQCEDENREGGRGAGVTGCRVFTKTEQLKRSWLTAIRQCIRVVNMPDEMEGGGGSHMFRLTTFDHVDGYHTCGVCKKLLLGLVSQGYMCQNEGCGFKVHAGCLQACPGACRHATVVVKRSSSDVVAPMRKKKIGVIRRRKTLEEMSASARNLPKYNSIDEEDDECFGL